MRPTPLNVYLHENDPRSRTKQQKVDKPLRVGSTLLRGKIKAIESRQVGFESNRIGAIRVFGAIRFDAKPTCLI